MKIFNLTFTIILLWCLVNNRAAEAQKESKSISCGFDELQKYLGQKDPNFQKKIAIAEQKITEKLHQTRNARTTGTIYTFPVVVHVIHTGGAIGTIYNPSDANIIAMINNLNNCWRKNGVSFGGVDIEIQFQLAKQSPNCTATTGINRVDGSSLTNYVSGGITNINAAGSADEVLVKNLSRWSNTDYINIWVVNKINGSEVFPGGYAYFPQYNSASTDGITLLSNVVDGSNKTIAHEMGHVFGLYHTFEGVSNTTPCPSNSPCNTVGDRICDTEQTQDVACGTNPNACSGSNYLIADVPHNYTVLNNYMGYTNCQFMFTQGQKDRILVNLLLFRPGLISSGGLNTSFNSIPKLVCSFVATNGLSDYYGVQRVAFNTFNVYSNTSTGDGSNYIDRTCNQQTKLTQGQIYPLIVIGSYRNPHKMKGYIDFNNNGDFSDAGEEILSVSGFGVDSITINVAIPINTNIIANKSLRMRIVADNPVPTDPTACNIVGDAMYHAGQAEEFYSYYSAP